MSARHQRSTPSKEAGDAAHDGKEDDGATSSPDETYFFNLHFLPYSRCAPIYTAFMGALLVYAFWLAFKIRLISVNTYGYIIHEFDPWFNYRAAEYMSTHGWTAFFRWFDYMSWYPLGRPVGSTTYPGLQFTAVAIHRSLAALGMPLTLNEVCVLMPAWFGALATMLLALMAHEISSSLTVTAVAAFSFAIIPAHLMRSMAGEFDNECIALAAMLLVFYLWMRSLRTPSSWPIGALAGVAYGYMVAAWGGYTFVLNMVALHAGVAALVDWGRNTYSNSLLRSYALFYVVGTSLSTLVPPVGMAPFKSLELLGALVVLLFLGSLQLCEVQRKRADVDVRSRINLRIRVRVFGGLTALAAVVIAVLMPMGYFGPVSSRVRALFVAHTRTGNPLVDSVAEHRPADAQSYLTYLNVLYPVWLMSFLVLPIFPTRNFYALLFILTYSCMAYYFSARMVRLLLLAGPAACVAGGAVLGAGMRWAFQQLFWNAHLRTADMVEAGEMPEYDTNGSLIGGGGRRKQQRARQQSAAAAASRANGDEYVSLVGKSFRRDLTMRRWPTGSSVAMVVLTISVTLGLPLLFLYVYSGYGMANEFAGPRIMFQYTPRQGETIMVKDYLESYEWLRDSTPEDARVLAWWDYGYQITGIGNRTSLADGNTWNHEHIATIGKMLTSPVAEAHSLVRHMADYVLIWAGQGGDLGKSPHMARIGNSVYHDICPDDPACKKFGFHERGSQKPTPMMKASLLYNLHEHHRRDGVEMDPALFQEVYNSKYGLVRIFKVMNVSLESKRWIADAANRVCDPPGSWICPGQYPPAKEIQDMLAHRVDFEQLENFNRKRNGTYYEAYMAKMRMERES